MATKRPSSKDFDLPTIPLKQSHIETPVSLTGQQQSLLVQAGRVPTSTILASTPKGHITSPIVATSIQKPGMTPTFVNIPGLLPTTSPLHTNTPLEYAAQATPTLSTPLPPTGIIPLGPQTLGLHGQLAAFASSLSPATPIGRPLITQTAAPLVSSAMASLVTATPTIPDAPPPPYSAVDTISDEFSCSSPSQFLHSPKAIQSAMPTDEKTLSLEKQKTSEDAKKQRMKLLSLRRAKMIEMKLKHEKMLQEKFFLEGGGNMMDYQIWRRKPNILKEQYMKQHDLDSEITVSDELLSPRELSQLQEKMETEAILEHESPLDIESISRQQIQQRRKENTLSSHGILTQTPTTSSLLQPSTPVSSVTSPSHSISLSSPRPPLRTHSTLSSVADVSHEDIVMRARHEAEVMKAISELRKEGLWSSSRLPKVHEPSRIKTHWDYLLEEMHWLATDFSNERRWKINAAKKLSRTVARHHHEQEQQIQRSQKEELIKLRKIASIMAKEVKHFWESIQKIVEHKQHALLEEKRRKAMDMHLNFIVDQTQKYSSWLMQGLMTTPASTNTPSEPSLISTASNEGDSDGLFTPLEGEGSDDEETINKEEVIAEKEGELDYQSELHQLQMEGDMPLDDLIASLPQGILEGAPPPLSSTEEEDGIITRRLKRKRTREVLESNESESEDGDKKVKEDEKDTTSDVEYSVTMETSDQEDETTISEQEEHEVTEDHSNEIDALQKEGELPIEDLLKLYNLERNPEIEEKETLNDNQQNEEESSDDESSAEEEEQTVDEPSLELLISGKSLEEACQTEQGLTDVAAAAQQLQPKGITLSTTEVKTKVPFLLRHKLREYQHIGLDWLVTMHERRLNGILADEMGLGKTIQTIALLAHLACEKGNWGPHLIIVPTSVMLNWEYEFKKWCPGFKILTYFGSFKERKQKRVGWSKFNAFHVCITSYNIAVQDHRAFKQKKWKYLILDEAQNIKNFKSQRWQTLLTFNSQHRLLLTGTPLQNNLMELWSLMHFLMPTVFASHSDFKEWFSNPLTGMVEGSQEYNESIVLRLHQVLRPFLLRRLKKEVEKQLPNKYEHVVLCKLSKRQRFLYEEYMSRAKTKETLAAGNYLSVINVLMQLRKVCNHPDLFEPRPVSSPFHMTGLVYTTASLVLSALSYNPFKHVSLEYFNLQLADTELTTDAFVSYRSRQLQAPRVLLTDLSCTDLDESLVMTRGEQPAELWMDLPDLNSKEQDSLKSQRESLHRINTLHCRRQPVYGQDMRLAVQTLHPSQTHHTHSSFSSSFPWLWSGYLACQLQQILPKEQLILLGTLSLQNLLLSYEDRSHLLEDILKRFVITVLPITTQHITLHACHPHPSDLLHSQQKHQHILTELSPLSTLLHPVATSVEFQFPETRLIQYDCGKLQTMDILLRRLRTEGHRVLLFTQMARMLDVLEIFLTYHGYTYLRLDGATPVQKRQALMDRFNRDIRVFCFILSTRSGGLGVNLTGADTVIFYDSDWNPTMDAQAQDRCHRIGQTRDVHIYRLVCESTIEENILKKANQKRILGDLAIESGAFTTDFFKKTTLNELFSMEQTESLEEPIEEKMSPKQLEELLLQAEEDHDVKAANMARAEQAAELAEFDEQYTSSSTQQTQEKQVESESSRVLLEFASLEEQLSGVERYAIKFIESENADIAEQQLRQAEENIQLAKKEWELSHLQQLREQEERMAREEEEEEEAMSLTYDRPELVNKIIIDDETGEEMPIWLPPTPPSDTNPDYYFDFALDMSYDTSNVMTPDALAAVSVYSDDDYDVFGLFKPPSEPKPTKKLSKPPTKFKREQMSIPQSLFWRRYTPDLLTTRIRKLSPQTKKVKGKAEQFTPLLEAQEGPEWLSFEDWVLIKGLTAALEVPLSLTATVPAQMPNWTILADLVSSLGKLKRSALQCKDRLVGVLIPREEQMYRAEELDPKKQKTREVTLKKHKSRREQRTRNQVIHDKGKEVTKQFNQCFLWINKAQEKRKQQSRQSSSDSSPRSSMHSELLQKDYDISVDVVCSPMLLAQQRAERIQSEIPRPSQVHQILSQGPAAYAQMTQLTRQYSNALVKPTPNSDLSKTFTLVSGSADPVVTTVTTTRPVATTLSTVAQLTQRIQASNIPSPTVVPESVSLQTLPAPVATTSTLTVTSTIPLLGKSSQIAVVSSVDTVPTPSTTTPTVSSTISNAAAAAAAAVAKTYPGVDISKGLFLGQRFTQQQLLLLRQTALQQQQLQQQQQQLQKQQQQHAITQQSVAAQQPNTVPQIQTQIQLQRQVQQAVASQQHAMKGQVKTLQSQTTTTSQPTVQIPTKIQIPGIEQLRPTIALSTQQRVQGALVRAGLPARSMQTEEVLALLRQQQALKLAMQNQAKLAQQAQQQLQASHNQAHAGLNEAIAAAAVAAAVGKQTPKPSIVTPAESVKVPPEQVSVVEASQLQVELVERSQTTSKQPNSQS